MKQQKKIFLPFSFAVQWEGKKERGVVGEREVGRILSLLPRLPTVR